MRVIADGPDGAVLWLAGGTPTQETRIVGWEETNAHDVPLKARFRPLAAAPTRINVEGTWRGRGVLKIVPPQVPFSVWVLLKDAGDGVDRPEIGGVRVEWYINLEATHQRSDDALFTSDHILDITFPISSMPLHAEDGRLDPTGAVFKDVDELAAAANYGAWPQEWSEIIRGQWQPPARPPRRFRGPSNPNETVARDLRGRPDCAASVSEKSFDQEHRAIPNGCYDRQHR